MRGDNLKNLEYGDDGMPLDFEGYEDTEFLDDDYFDPIFDQDGVGFEDMVNLTHSKIDKKISGS